MSIINVPHSSFTMPEVSGRPNKPTYHNLSLQFLWNCLQPGI